MKLTPIFTLAVAGLGGCVTAMVATPEFSRRTYNAPGWSDADTHLAIRRDLEVASLEKRRDLTGNTTFDRSWNGAVLLKFGAAQSIQAVGNTSASASQSVEITCKTCYIKGLASASLHIPDNFNASTAINNTVSAVKNKVVNFTETIDDYLVDYFKGVIKNFDDGIDLSDFAFPPLNYSFDMAIPPIKDVTLDFGFDGLELYLGMDVVLGAALTYEMNLYVTNTPIGIGIGKDTMLGVVFKVDLLLNAQGAIDISSGLHIKLDKGVKMKIALFGDRVSDIAHNGAQFEFLPVTVLSAGVVLSATLRIGIHAGISIATPGIEPITVFNQTVGIPKLQGGIEVGVYANFAEFTTNVTATPDDKDCKLQLVQEYQMALGAAAGASVALGSDTWGPVASTSIAIFSTELKSLCAIQATKTPVSVSATPTPTKRIRDVLFTTRTTTTKITHTGVLCKATVAGNCPMSLQETTQSTETRTLTASALKGQTPTFPASVSDTVTSTATFGKNMIKMAATSGSPTSYTPPPTSTSGSKDGEREGAKDGGATVLDGNVGGVNEKLIIGLSVGLGVPLLVGVVVAIFMFRKRRKYNSVPGGAAALFSSPIGGETKYEPYRMEGKKEAAIEVAELRR